jgi:hypothetical protein
MTSHTANTRLEWLAKELKKAYKAARAGKISKPEVIAFDKIAKSEIAALAQEIHTRSYTTSPINSVYCKQAR